MEKVEKVHFCVAIELFDMKVGIWRLVKFI